MNCYAVGTILLMMSICMDSRASMIAVSFDAPVCPSAVHKSIDLVAHIVGDVQALQAAQMSPYERSLVHDASIGRIVRLHEIVESVYQEVGQGAMVVYADIEYIAAQVDHIIALYAESSLRLPIGAVTLLEQIQQKLHLLLS